MVFWPVTADPALQLSERRWPIRNIHSQVLPASLVTKMLFDPLFATPTNILGVALPKVPDVVSKVTQAIPSTS